MIFGITHGSGSVMVRPSGVSICEDTLANVQLAFQNEDDVITQSRLHARRASPGSCGSGSRRCSEGHAALRQHGAHNANHKKKSLLSHARDSGQGSIAP
jgi:hypothetical protein